MIIGGNWVPIERSIKIIKCLHDIVLLIARIFHRLTIMASLESRKRKMEEYEMQLFNFHSRAVYATSKAPPFSFTVECSFRSCSTPVARNDMFRSLDGCTLVSCGFDHD